VGRESARITRLLLLAIACLAGVDGVIAQDRATAVPTAQEIAARADEYVTAAMRVNRFSGSVLVARDGRPLIKKGYGMANYELDVANTPQTVFRIGSLTKAFTATAVMMLQERGKLRIDDPICSHLSDCPAAWQPVTIKHLLMHTSGILSFTELPDYPKTMALGVTHDSQIAKFRDKPLEFNPGEKYKYSNSGYYLLGVIIERVSGRPYADFLQENIFQPAGMASSGYDSSRRIIKNRASGYTTQSESLVNALPIDMSIPFAAGAVISTAEDLLRWDQALYTEKLLSRKSFDEMFTPSKEERGYGWAIRRRFERQVIEHDGGVNGFSASLSRFPADRVVVIVLGNNATVASRTIANDLSAIVFGAPYTVPQERRSMTLDAGALAKFVGQYQFPPDAALAANAVHTVTIENGRLMRQVNETPKVELLAASDTEFFPKGVDAEVIFKLDAAGRVTGMTVRRAGREATARKVK
jgi:CubicO group peptidase (beta-lactamase class C family)